jgi:hypothetical protein
MPERLDVLGVEDDDHVIDALIDRDGECACTRRLNERARNETGRFEDRDGGFRMGGNGRAVSRCTVGFP